MSLTTSIILIAVLDVAIIAALAAVSTLPFRLDRPRPATPATLRRPASADLLELDEAAA